jgi:hypothetical protein
MRLQRFGIVREDFLLPLARTGDKVRGPFADANSARHDESLRSADELQRKATRKWATPQHRDKSAIAMAKLIDPEHWNTTRRKIKKP